jgi:hypothetical protein
MSITSSTLVRASGISAVLAGLIFIGVQINHPPLNATTITTAEVTIRNTAKLAMGALALAGITGMYLRQIRQVGVLGLIGYLMFSGFYVVSMPIEFTAAFVLPSVAHIDPRYVNDVLAAAVGGTAAGDIGLLPAVFLLAGVLYMAGGLVFGIALSRARVLARWAAVLLAVGTSATLALAVLPDSFNRPFAVPTGIALVGLGFSLWREQRGKSPESGSSQPSASSDLAGVR